MIDYQDSELLTAIRSLMNTSQLLPDWQEVMGTPLGSTLGLLSAMYNIGSIVSLPLVPFLSDRYGRKLPIIIGCVIMIVAAAVQVGADPK